VSGCPPVNVVLIAPLAVWERGNGKDGAAVRGIIRAKEGSKALVGGYNISFNAGRDLLRKTLLLLWGDVGGILLRRSEEGIGIYDALALNGDLFEQETHGHEVVRHAGAEDLRGLAEDTGDLVKPGDVVFIVLHGIKGNGQRQICKIGVDAEHLVDRHLVFFQFEVVDALLEDT
jgi:hypothetical protein